MHSVEEVHDRVVRQTSSLKPLRTFVKNKTSVHVLNSFLTMRNLVEFAKVANNEHMSAFFGSLNGELVLSARKVVKSPDASPARKRRRDNAVEQVDRAIAKIRKTNSEISDEMYERARQALLQLLKVQGSLGEAVIESWSISIRNPGTWGGATTARLVIAFRLAAGIAVSIDCITEALHEITDGMLTVDETKIPSCFKLPLSPQGIESTTHGQTPVSAFASVS